MKKLAAVSLALLVAGIMAGAVVAGEKEVTLEGEMVCAKCTLKVEGLDKCQNVLMVKTEGETTQYWMAKSEANDEFGYVCKASKKVRVTGTVSEKDGKKWIAATKIAPMEKEG